MATFMDLPKDVQETIYRLHLVRDEPITNDEHKAIVGYDPWESPKCMPPIFAVSSKMEKECAPIYYGENHFDLDRVCAMHRLGKFFCVTPRRHLKFVRTVTWTWAPAGSPAYVTSTDYGTYGTTGENFRRLSKLNGLKELNIRVGEAEIINCMSIGREVRQHLRGRNDRDLTSQQAQSIFRFPGVQGLLSISSFKKLHFIEREDDKGKAYGGLVSGGPIETYILPRLRTAQLPPKRLAKKRPFRFLDLPPELRDRIYDLILRIPGPIHPSKDKPTTAPRDKESPRINESQHWESALSLLLVNRQIHDEAIGIFYNANAFVFYYPTQLHAFLMSIGHKRQQLLQDICVDYYNLSCGGIDLVELTFPMLKQLRGLRRLHVVMRSRQHEIILRRGWFKIPFWRSRMVLRDANPNLIPGIRHLFDLRGVSDIKIQDMELEKKVKELEKEPAYPDFSNNKDNRSIMQLSRAFEHFNLALAAAQKGNVNREVLESRDWHEKEEFPKLEAEEEREGEVDNEEDGNGDSSDLSDVDSDYDFGW